MAAVIVVDTPERAHALATAHGQDAANRQMRAAGRATWNRADYNLCAATVQRWYGHFNILNARQWLPAGYAWRQVRGSWKPVKVRT